MSTKAIIVGGLWVYAFISSKVVSRIRNEALSIGIETLLHAVGLYFAIKIESSMAIIFYAGLLVLEMLNLLETVILYIIKKRSFYEMKKAKEDCIKKAPKEQDKRDGVEYTFSESEYKEID